MAAQVDPFLVARAVMRSGVTSPKSFVYILRAGLDGDIKIGLTRSVGNRFAATQTGNSSLLVTYAEGMLADDVIKEEEERGLL